MRNPFLRAPHNTLMRRTKGFCRLALRVAGVGDCIPSFVSASLRRMFCTILPMAQAVAPPGTGGIIETGLRFTQAMAVYLGLAAAFYLILLFGGRILKRRLGIPLNWVYHLFCILAALYLPTLFAFVPIPGEQHVAAALALTGAFVVVGLQRHYFFDQLERKGEGVQVPKFLGEFISISIIIATLLFVLQFFYKIQVPGLLAGAGILGIVLGLALQDTLGNIFSGFAIYFGGQFKAGDWLLVEGQHAQIVEINWRSTRLRTTDDICLDIPNSGITKQTVINYNYPTNIHGIRLDIGLEYDAPPTLVKKVLIDAALDSPLVLRSPMPDVYLMEFGNFSVTYQLRFWLDDHVNYNPANSQIRTNLWYALRRHNIKIPYPIQEQRWMGRPQPHVEDRDLIRGSIRKAIFASALSATQLDEIVENAKIVRFGEGESIIRQDAEAAGPMFVIVSGRAEVWVESNGQRTSVAVLGPDACIGEISVLTGEKRTATILALEDCLAVEVDKDVLAPIIGASPELLESLSELLAQRRMANEGLVAEAAGFANQATKSNYKEGFLGKIRTFFEV
ncbi:MAG: cyclic nucleotide-binding domain-containing protein [Verrucomicrobiota bacterium]